MRTVAAASCLRDAGSENRSEHDPRLPGSVAERTAQPSSAWQTSQLVTSPKEVFKVSRANTFTAYGSESVEDRRTIRTSDVRRAATLPPQPEEASIAHPQLRRRIRRILSKPLGLGALAHALLVKHLLRNGNNIDTSKKVMIAKRVFDRWEELDPEQQTLLLSDLFPSSRWVFVPSQPMAKRWDRLMSLVMLYVIVVTPFDVAFLPTTAGAVFFCNRATDLVFAVDIVLSFFRSYSLGSSSRGIKPEWEINLRKVALRYLSHGFATDLIALLASVFEIVPLLVDINRSFVVVRVIRLIRLTRLVKMSDVFERCLERADVPYSVGEFIRGMLYLLFAAHMMACLWGYTALTEIGAGSPSWLGVSLANKKIDIGDLDPWPIYLMSLYWAFMTLTSIGYGDIAPYTLAEVIITTALMLVGAAVWTYFVSVSISAVSAMDRDRSLCGATLGELNELSSEFNVSDSFRARARQFIHNSQLHSRLADYPNILNSVSSNLRSQIDLHVKEALMMTAPYLMDRGMEEHDSKVLQHDVAELMEQSCFNSNEWVVPAALDRHVRPLQARDTSISTFSNLTRFCNACEIPQHPDTLPELLSRGTLTQRQPPPIAFLESGLVMRRFKLQHGCWHKDAVVTVPALRDLEVARSLSFSSVFFLEPKRLIRCLEQGEHFRVLKLVRRKAAHYALMTATLRAAKYRRESGDEFMSYKRATECVLAPLCKPSRAASHHQQRKQCVASVEDSSSDPMTAILGKLESIDKRLSQSDSNFAAIQSRLQVTDERLIALDSLLTSLVATQPGGQSELV